MVMEDGIKTLEQVSASTTKTKRSNLSERVKDELMPLMKGSNPVVSCLDNFVTTDEECVRVLQNAKGSFGLCVTTSLDAHRQVAMAAKGQTLCIVFYPRKGALCYGSEQAAVKAGIATSS
eukprot:scaffold1579_cov102-Skeletonema_dohrnii-CCMP3373.AAC.5